MDGTVVVMENIFSDLTKPDAVPAEAYLGVVQSRKRRMNLLIQAATHEVTSPVFFSVMIIAVVFSPLFTLEGVESKLFMPMAISIIVAMLASLLVALVVDPRFGKLCLPTSAATQGKSDPAAPSHGCIVTCCTGH